MQRSTFNSERTSGWELFGIEVSKFKLKVHNLKRLRAKVA